jgi:pantoate kinase
MAEIKNNTGLGDVIAQATGGMVYRKRAGAIGFGEVEKLPTEEIDVYIYVLGEGIITSSIITNHEKIKKINSVGAKYIENFEKITNKKNDYLKTMLELAFKFAIETELINEKNRKIIESIHSSQIGLGSMVMLGNAIFLIGDIGELKKYSITLVKPIISKINNACAHLID